MTNYRRGYTGEKYVERKFEEGGFAVIRSAGSHKVDLVAGRGSDKYCIEVKTGKEKAVLDPESYERLKTFSEKFGCTPLLVFRAGRKWRVICGDKIKPGAYGGDDGIPLKEFLKKISLKGA